jgi:hypothetical protein
LISSRSPANKEELKVKQMTDAFSQYLLDVKDELLIPLLFLI